MTRRLIPVGLIALVVFGFGAAQGSETVDALIKQLGSTDASLNLSNDRYARGDVRHAASARPLLT